MRNFKNQKIIITGGSKGIGRSVAVNLAKEGATVAIIARDQKMLAETLSELKKAGPGSEHISKSADVSDSNNVTDAITKIGKKWGQIDGLICCAGFAHPEYFDKTSLDVFEKCVKVDYLGTIYSTKAAINFIKAGGFISIVSSVVGYMGVFGYTSYAGPKFALIGFAETLYQELLPRKINVTVLCPPDTDTPGYAEENLTKPFETKALSESAKIMAPGKVAEIYLKNLKKK